MRILEEETFGLVAPVMSFSTDAEAIELANAVPYDWRRTFGPAI